MFSDVERDFLKSQRLLRLATVSQNGQPDADAVGFTFDGERFYVGGRDLRATRKYRNVASSTRRPGWGVRFISSVLCVLPKQERQVVVPWNTRIKVMGGLAAPGPTRPHARGRVPPTLAARHAIFIRWWCLLRHEDVMGTIGPSPCGQGHGVGPPLEP
jgi:PPOX class F420-dependent enzyme/OxyR family protein